MPAVRFSESDLAQMVNDLQGVIGSPVEGSIPAWKKPDVWHIRMRRGVEAQAQGTVEEVFAALSAADVRSMTTRLWSNGLGCDLQLSLSNSGATVNLRSTNIAWMTQVKSRTKRIVRAYRTWWAPRAAWEDA